MFKDAFKNLFARALRNKNRRRHISLITQWLLVIMTGTLLFYFAAPDPMPQLNYTQLLDTIAKGESRGNYNAYYGQPNNSSIKFTGMTIEEVLRWQSNYIKQGSPSNAVGRYQIIQPTLQSLIRKLDVDKQEHFDEAMQDKMAIALLEKRGVNEYSTGEISREEFAHNLSKEWAALPKAIGDNPTESYYAGDGLNKVQVSVNEIYRGIEELEK